jgi:hypothetical protein
MQSCQKSEKQFEMIAASDGSYFFENFLENTCYLLQSKYTQDITKIKHSLTSHAVIYNQL